ncbi:phage tail terminator-like protein [Tardiphaga sp.]|uniref:phage tail terminator-like protein n=1 Tax=Tardiphaga sp. TaxID=1926292 RepID=UPI0026043376|nr:phage tail terminator-like protein [Tardiphaga sp.]MDB5618466.1 hypothetical protein [Tardiphaga sp.]
MAGKKVVDAVAARLAANWTLCAIIDDDTSGQGTGDGKPYVTIEYPVSAENQITVGAPGNNVFRESGAFRIVLSFSTGSGLSQPLDWIDQLRALFRGKQFDGVTTWAPSPAAVDNSNYVGGRFLISFSTPYFADIFA